VNDTTIPLFISCQLVLNEERHRSISDIFSESSQKRVSGLSFDNLMLSEHAIICMNIGIA